jgi:E3 ubiquitin-protein ligase RNF6
MADMDSDHVLVVPDTPDRIQQSACPASSSVARRDVDPSPRRRFRFKTRNNSMHGPSSQADAFSVLPAHADADNIFRQADVARALAFPEGSEAKLPSQKSNKTTGTSLLNEKRAEKRVLDQRSCIINNISSSDAGERRHSCQIRDVEVSQQEANHQNGNFLDVGSVLPTIPVGKPQNRTGISISIPNNRLKAVTGPDVCPGSSSEVNDEMIITGSSRSPSVVPQRHVGQKRLVRNGCISPSNVAQRSVKVDIRQEMCSPRGVLHHQHPQHDVFATANAIDLTDNSSAITRHGDGVNISANIMDTRAAKRLGTDRAGEALVPPSEYVANGFSGVSLSGRNNKGKEISHDMLDSKRIGVANSTRYVLILSVLISVISSFFFPLLI